jgi:TPR repeat protein
VCRGSLQSEEALWAEWCQLYRREQLLPGGGAKTAIYRQQFGLLQRICQIDHKAETAQYNLDIIYETGNGAEKDMQKAAMWYRKSAEQGYPKPQFNLASIYENGDGVEKDMQLAVMWYRLAAEQGHPKPQFNLACIYVRLVMV